MTDSHTDDVVRYINLSPNTKLRSLTFSAIFCSLSHHNYLVIPLLLAQLCAPLEELNIQLYDVDSSELVRFPFPSMDATLFGSAFAALRLVRFSMPSSPRSDEIQHTIEMGLPLCVARGILCVSRTR